jgi:hypothetical protein
MTTKRSHAPCPCGSREFIIKEVTYHRMRLRHRRLYAVENDIAGDLAGTISCARCTARYPLRRYKIGDMSA